MVSAFFSQAKTGSIAGTMLFFVAYFLQAIIEGRPSVTTSTITAICLSAPAALSMGVTQLALFEGNGVGVQWSNIHVLQNNFSFALSMGMLFVDFCLYSFLGWYFDQVLPQEFGTTKSPFFLFLPSYWFPGSVSNSTADNAIALLEEGDDDFASSLEIEAVAMDLRSQEREMRCVEVRKLRKTFSTPDGEKVAVKGLDLRIYSGQIFALLGHNGAGKTTTISMLCGMIPPTAGDASFQGKSINSSSDMARIRRALGVCPQHDVLYKEMTVKEHLIFYGQLKGLKDGALEEQVSKRIVEVGLTEKVNVRSGNLSGGQKRKLSVAITLMGDSKLVFMDEPTSGMVSVAWRRAREY
jgi:ABC-type Na+ transport system ATPase subunit NatA